jgi:anti-sigma factor ChrR (cupin superfamily)
MDKRKITNLDKLDFKPFDKYGEPIKGWYWHKISFDKKTNFGTYISKLEPGTKTIPHTHTGHEEFLILDGELIDSDGSIFKKGDFISYKPNSSHSSYTKKGCLILTFMRGHNNQIKKDKL